jgi:hypothetical protein
VEAGRIGGFLSEWDAKGTLEFYNLLQNILLFSFLFEKRNFTFYETIISLLFMI